MQMKSVVSTALLLGVVALPPISSQAFASTPPTPPGCPDGWVPAPNTQLGCLPNKIKIRPTRRLNRKVKNPTQSNQVTFPPEIPTDFTYNKCELGIIDPVDCPENNPIPAPRD